MQRDGSGARYSLTHFAHTRTQVYTYERGDGVGRAHDLIIQGFIRGVATAALPVAICAGVLYVLVSVLHSIVTIHCMLVL